MTAVNETHAALAASAAGRVSGGEELPRHLNRRPSANTSTQLPALV